MILKGSQRGGARDLALHLLKDENDHVVVHELRGFAADTLTGALKEAHAISKGTRCRQFLYSLSVNPPPSEQISSADIEAAIEKAEVRLGLSGQPRAIVFHEKEGRRHAHVVWSRIDPDAMKAVHMGFDHARLMSLSRELFLEHGWRMPEGLARSEARDPRNFTLEDWQQAKRTGRDPRSVKAAIQDAWAISDSPAGLWHALDERGFYLARGDRRGFVVVDGFGEVYSLPRMAGVKTKDVAARLGDLAELPTVDEAKARIAQEVAGSLRQLQDGVEERALAQESEFVRRRRDLVARQRRERANLADRQLQRREQEARLRQARFRRGLAGVWDRLRGRHRRIQEENVAEATWAAERDRKERDDQVIRHLAERRKLSLFRYQARRDRSQDRHLLRDQLHRHGTVPERTSGPEPDW